MNTWISNDSEGKYLYAELPSEENSFEISMIRSISADNILPLSERFRDGKQCLEYNVSGLVTLKEYLTGHSLDEEALSSVIIQVGNAADTVRNYLLSENSLRIRSSEIFVSEEEAELKFCVIPGEGENFEEELKTLISELLINLNLEDEQALRLGFQLLKTTQDPEFRLHDVLSAVQRKKTPGTLKKEIFTAPPRSAAAEAPDDTEAFSGLPGMQNPDEKYDNDAIIDSEFYDTEEKEKEAPKKSRNSMLTGLAVSQGILAAGAVVVFLVKGKATVLRMLPVYLILALCVTAYSFVDYKAKRRTQNI